MNENPSVPPSSTAPSFSLRGQYIKDLSFENPRAPESLLTPADKPSMDVGVDLKAQVLQDGIYELTLHISARALADGKTVFLADLAYAGIFALQNIPQDQVEKLLLTDGPFILFPFARRVIADVSRDGGFPPLMLEPIDFYALYSQRLARRGAASSPQS